MQHFTMQKPFTWQPRKAIERERGMSYVCVCTRVCWSICALGGSQHMKNEKSQMRNGK